MKQWKWEMLVIFMVLMNSVGLCQPGTTLKYRESTAGTARYYEESLWRNEAGARLSLKDEKKQYQVEADTALRASYCTIEELGIQSRIAIRRAGTILKITANDTTFTRQIDSSPWYATMNSLANFIISQATKEYFWVVSADFGEVKSVGKGITALKFVAVKKGEEVVTVDGRECRAVKVTVTFPDWKSIFWRAQYWFRLTDGLLLRSEQVRGGPGTPKTIVELVSENTSQN